MKKTLFNIIKIIGLCIFTLLCITAFVGFSEKEFWYAFITFLLGAVPSFFIIRSFKPKQKIITVTVVNTNKTVKDTELVELKKDVELPKSKTVTTFHNVDSICKMQLLIEQTKKIENYPLYRHGYEFKQLAVKARKDKDFIICLRANIYANIFYLTNNSPFGSGGKDEVKYYYSCGDERLEYYGFSYIDSVMKNTSANKDLICDNLIKYTNEIKPLLIDIVKDAKYVDEYNSVKSIDDVFLYKSYKGDFLKAKNDKVIRLLFDITSNFDINKILSNVFI